jgi:hypothetical protein
MRKCRFCEEQIADAAIVCPHCGRDLIPGRVGAAPVAASAPAAASLPIARVSVVNIDMPFGQMIWFMLKWGVAAIPALLILAVCGALLAGVFAGLLTAINTSARTAAVADRPALAPAIARARQLRGFSYAQVIEALGQPTSQIQGELTYRVSTGDVLKVRLENDRVVATEPTDFDLAMLKR